MSISTAPLNRHCLGSISTCLLDGFAMRSPYGAYWLAHASPHSPASGQCFEEVNVTVHELGHAFGLLHDFRNDLKPWIDLYSTEPMTTSPCAAEWLDVHRYFNSHQIYFDEPTTVEMWSPGAVHPDGIRLRFKIMDLDSLHQAQLFTTIEYLNNPVLEHTVLGWHQ